MYLSLSLNSLQAPARKRGTKSKKNQSTVKSTIAESEVAMTTTSPPNSQGSSSSEAPTPVHMATTNGVADEGEGETPIPPPRKKKTTRKRMALPTKKSSESSIDLLSPDGSVSGSSNGGQRSPGECPAPLKDTNNRSHDQISDDTSQSPDPFSEEDMFPPVSNSMDCYDSSLEVSRHKHINGSLSIVGGASDTPSSRTSLMAMLDSTSSGLGQRPYSVLVSPYDTSAQFYFPDEGSSSRLSGLITLPRGGAQTWSARTQLMNQRQSQRSAQFPYSSKSYIHSCT